MKMKLSAAIAMALCPVLFLTSCVYEYPAYSGGAYYGGGGYYGVDGYGYASNPYIYSAGVSAAWTPASYDADGFPIYGYSYGRPVYGYTEAGVAIFTLAAITAACLVPRWDPAPWYHGHWHYPHGCHRIDAPHHFPHGHCPGVRPHGGINAPIHQQMMRNMMAANKQVIKAEQKVIMNQAKAVQNVAKAQQKMAGAQFQAAQNMAAAQQKMIANQAKATVKMQQAMLGIKPKSERAADIPAVSPAPIPEPNVQNAVQSPANRDNAASRTPGQFQPVLQRKEAGSPANDASFGNRHSGRSEAASFNGGHSFQASRPSAPAMSTHSFSAPRSSAPAFGGNSSSFGRSSGGHGAASFGGNHGGMGGGAFGGHHKR